MHNTIFTIGPLTIHGYGLMIGIGVLFGIWVGTLRAKKYGANPDYVMNIALWALLWGFFGAKLLFILVNLQEFTHNPWLVFSSEGFVVYGGIIAGILSSVLYCRKKKIDFLFYFDILIPSVSLTQGFGRIGCLLAGCCYGCPTDAWYGIVFPTGSIAPAGIRLFPSQIVSSAGDFLIAIILIVFYKRLKFRGDCGALYLLLYGIGRFVIEYFRSDCRGTVGPFSTSQFISLLMILGSLISFWFNRRNGVARTANSSDK